MSETEIQQDKKSDFELLRTFVINGNLQAVETLLKIKKDIDLDAYDSLNYTLCGLAAFHNFPKVFEALCKAGADPSICCVVLVDETFRVPQSLQGKKIWWSPIEIARCRLTLDPRKEFERIAREHGNSNDKTKINDKKDQKYSKQTIAIWRIEKSLTQNRGRFGISAKPTGWFFTFSDHDYFVVNKHNDWFDALEEMDKSTPLGTYTEDEEAANHVAFSLINESLPLFPISINNNGPKWTIKAMGEEHTVSAVSMAQALCQVYHILFDKKETVSTQDSAKVQNKITTEDAIEQVLDRWGRLAIEKQKDGKWSISLGDHGILSIRMQSTDKTATWQEALRNFSSVLVQQ